MLFITDMCFWCVLIGVNFRLFIKHNCLLHPHLTLEIDYANVINKLSTFPTKVLRLV